MSPQTNKTVIREQDFWVHRLTSSVAAGGKELWVI